MIVPMEGGINITIRGTDFAENIMVFINSVLVPHTQLVYRQYTQNNTGKCAVCTRMTQWQNERKTGHGGSFTFILRGFCFLSPKACLSQVTPTTIPVPVPNSLRLCTVTVFFEPN